MARKQKPKGGTEIKKLCAMLWFIAETNMDIANEAQAAADDKGAQDAIDIVVQATADMDKWGCGKQKRAARMRERIAVLSRATAS
jgi:hypothetical protein